jgi:hypothetical protein
METRRGGCNCGAVRLQAEGPPLRTGLCHCLTCRKATGSVFSAFGIWPRDQVVVTGETRHWEDRHFCPGCGSSVFGLSEEDDEIEVHLGSLDAGPGDLTPSYELWIKRREHWLTSLPGAAQHVEDRPQEEGSRSSAAAICRCARDACTRASSRADAGLPPVPPGSGECGVLVLPPAWHPRPSR